MSKTCTSRYLVLFERAVRVDEMVVSLSNDMYGLAFTETGKLNLRLFFNAYDVDIWT